MFLDVTQPNHEHERINLLHVSRYTEGYNETSQPAITVWIGDRSYSLTGKAREVWLAFTKGRIAEEELRSCL